DRGALRSISMPRWGDPDGTGYAERLFAVSFGGEVRADGFTLPRAIEAAWGPPVDAAARAPAAPAGDRLGDPFLRATITAARFVCRRGPGAARRGGRGCGRPRPPTVRSAGVARG